MSSIPAKKAQCKDCKEINPNCPEVYVMANRCILGPHFHYQKNKAIEYEERKAAKYINSTPKSITISKTKKVCSKEQTLSRLLKLAQSVFNEYIRKRDLHDGIFKCISCGESKETDEMNAGHYYSAGNHSYLRFNEYNVHGQCIKCNCYLHGNLIPYRDGLLKKIGPDQLQKLDLFKNVSQKWNKVQLKALIEIYRRKIREDKFDFFD